MKLKKIAASAVASAVAVSAMGIAASAAIAIPENKASNLEAGSGMWEIFLLRNEEGDRFVDLGIDLEAIKNITIQFTTDDPEWFEGSFGGSVFVSCGPASATPADHNWAQKNWWGVVDEDLEINTQNPEEALLTEKIGDHTYQISVDLDDSNCFYGGDEVTYAGAGIQEWGSDMSQMVVLGATFSDANGNVLIAFDGNGNITEGGSAAPAETEAAPAETEAAPAETEAAPAGSEATPAGSEATPAGSEAAPAGSEAAATQAPAAGNVAAATDSSKGSPDTGIADVAAIAGVAIVAAGAVLVAKKRK